MKNFCLYYEYCQFLTMSSTFNWNYSDLFIVSVSFYLTSRIEQVNIKLKAAHGKYLPESVWRTFRKEYNRVTRLVRKFDDVISAVVFASFASNLFFICLQLYNTLRNGIKHGLAVVECLNFPSGPLGGYEHAVYFLFSLMFLMLKSLTVSLIAARVHSASLVPATALYAVPSPVYCVEVQRFLDQIHGEKVALTGLRFFHITKDLALSVAGTIVTYELVLLQFDSDVGVHHSTSNNSSDMDFPIDNISKQLEKNNLWVTDKKVNQEKPNANTVTFHKSMKLTLFIGQCLGLNPVMGIFNNDGARLRFSFKSWKIYFCIYIILAQGTATSLAIYRLLDFGTSYELIGLVSFYGSIFTTTLLFLSVAPKWPALVREVEITELADPIQDKGLSSRINMAALSILLMAVFEHILSLVARFADITDSHPEENADLYRIYTELTYPWLFELGFCTYSVPFAIALQFTNFLTTINWSYSSIFIISISLYLTSRIEQVTMKVIAVQGQRVPPSVWRSLREDYNRIVNLIKSFDEVISAVVFFAFACNLLFICLSLFSTLRNQMKREEIVPKIPQTPTGILGGYEQQVYLVGSLSALILRSLTLSLVAARVHSATLMLTTTLYEVSSSTYCVELQRFLDQLHNETVALTGLQFFNVTRGLALSVAGTIVTYELVLLQFDPSGGGGYTRMANDTSPEANLHS